MPIAHVAVIHARFTEPGLCILSNSQISGDIEGARNLNNCTGIAAERGAFVARTLNLRDLEEVAIRRSLVEMRGNRSRASEALGISVRTLRNKIRLYELR